MTLVAIICLLSGALVKAAHSDRRTHESKLFQSLWDTLEKGEVLVADRGFCSSAALASLLARGVDSLMLLRGLINERNRGCPISQ